MSGSEPISRMAAGRRAGIGRGRVTNVVRESAIRGVRRRRGHRGPPPRVLEQAVSWAAPHGGADGPVRRSGHGARCVGLVYAAGVGEFGMLI